MISYLIKWFPRILDSIDLCKVIETNPHQYFQEFNNNKVQLIAMFEEEVKGKKGTLKPPVKLVDYSKWMADFNPNTHGRNLEIPGTTTFYIEGCFM